MAYDEARAFAEARAAYLEEEVKQRISEAAEAANKLVAAHALILQCRKALDEELAGWDIDPPLDHILKARDACVKWLFTQSQGGQPATSREQGDDASGLTAAELVPMFRKTGLTGREAVAAARAIAELRKGADHGITPATEGAKP